MSMKDLKLEDLPNVGPAVASKLRLIGIETPSDLAGRDPFQMYEELGTRTASDHDPCLLDVRSRF
jgi:nucleotidyltransferase/DNA polymerase involved in DNA repair